MDSPRDDRCRHGVIALLLALSSLGWIPAEREDDGEKGVRAAAERFLADWNNGRLSDSYEGFSARLRQLVTLTQLEASLVAVRKELGTYVAMDVERLSEDRIDDQRSVVLDATLRFERGTTRGRFVVLAERGAWRLRFVQIDLPLEKRPPLDDAPVARIADEILVGLEREGLASVVRLLPHAREQFGEQAVRELFERMAHTLGAMRSHSLGAPSVVSEDGRQLTGRGRFEHGEAALRIALYADRGVWRLLGIDIAPDMTPLLFERMAWATLSQTLKRSDFVLSCPTTLVPVGSEAPCRFTSQGQTRGARVRRVEDADLDVVLVPE